MSNYLERFRSMVAEIEAHPLLEVVTFSINPPISEQVLAQIELFSYSSCMAFLLETETREEGFKVSRLGDHYIEWQDNRITDFASYLEMLLATRGIVQARESIYQEEGGERLPSLVTTLEYWTEEKIPKLFRYSL